MLCVFLSLNGSLGVVVEKRIMGNSGAKFILACIFMRWPASVVLMGIQLSLFDVEL